MLDRDGPKRLWTSFGDYVTDRFGEGIKAYKVTLDAGFSCPNIDGTVTTGGCTYCNNRSFSPPLREPRVSLAAQVERGVGYYRRRNPESRFFAYFQAYSNTHAPVEVLRSRYDEALASADFLGLDIGTRPDCVDEARLDLLESYSDRYEIWIEYGIQTIHDRTLVATNRGHDYDTFRRAVEATQRRPIKICAHLIHGLPGESHEDMLRSVEALADLGLDGIKIHHAYVARGTPLAADYEAGRYRPLELEAYLDLLIASLERLPRSMVVHRLVGEFPGQTGGPSTLSRDAVVVAPEWGVDRPQFLALLRKEMRRRGTHQGARTAQSTS